MSAAERVFRVVMKPLLITNVRSKPSQNLILAADKEVWDDIELDTDLGLGSGIKKKGFFQLWRVGGLGFQGGSEAGGVSFERCFALN